MLPVAGEGAIPGPQSDISEHALLPHGVQVGQDAVGMGRLVEQRDVHGARAGAGFPILMNSHRHGSFVWHLQGVAWNNLSYCSMRMTKRQTGNGTAHQLFSAVIMLTAVSQMPPRPNVVAIKWHL